VAEYVFKGNAPFEYVDEDGVLLVCRPLDVQEFGEEPGYPWELVPGEKPEAAEPPAKAPAEPPVVITPDGPRAPAGEKDGG
jgi:hypothetical protein